MKKILVVEDELIVAKDIVMCLEKLGYVSGGIASTAEEALSKAAEDKPDLVLMDIVLRGRADGIELAAEFQKGWGIPVVFLTAHADEATLRRATQSKPFGYIVKPFDERDLHSSIEVAFYRHHTEKLLAENRQWLFTILESITDGIIATDREGKVNFVNSVAEGLTGWSREECLGKNLEEVVEIADAGTGARIKDLRALMAAGRGIKARKDFQLLPRSGGRYVVTIAGVVIHNDRGESTGEVFTFRDVTARRLAENRLRASEEKYRALVTFSSEHLFMLDLNGTYLTSNDQVGHLGVAEGSSLVGKNVRRVYPPDLAGLYMERLSHVAATGEAIDFEHELQSRGDTIYHLDTLYPIWREGKIYAVGGICRDITENRENQLAVKEREEELRAIYENTPVLIVLLDKERRVRHANEVAFTFTGGPAADMIGKRGGEALRCIHALDVPEGCGFGPACEECTVRTTVLDTYETGRNHRDVGARMWVSCGGKAEDAFVLLSTTRLALRQESMVLVTMMDITERKRAEEGLREAELNYRTIFNSASDAIFLHDIESGRILEVNEAACQLYGYSREAMKALNVAQLSSDTPPYTIKEAMEWMRKGIEEGPQFFTWRAKRGDGTLFWVEDNLKRVMIGGQDRILVAGRDITERKLADQAISESEERFRRVSGVTSDIVYSCSTKEDGRFAIEWMTGAAEDITGYSSEEIKAQGCWRFLVVEEDLSLFDKNVTGLTPGSQGSCELRVRHKNGDIVWIASRVECIAEPQTSGRFFLFGGLADITERKLAEKELRAFSQMVEQSTESIVCTDAEFRITYLNSAAQELFGWTLEEVRGKRPAMLNAEPFAHEMQEEIYQSVRAGEPCFREALNRKKSGEIFFCQFKVSPLYDVSGLLCGAMGSQRDITKVKQVELEQQALQDRLESLWGLTERQDDPLESIADYVLRKMLEMSKSQHGFFGCTNEEETVLYVYALKGFFLEGRGVLEKPMEFAVENAGIWGEAIRERKTFVINDYSQDLAAKSGVPEGHVPLTRLMSVPVFSDNGIATVIAVANKESEYTEADIKAIEHFMQNSRVVFDRKRSSEALLRSEEQLRTLALRLIGTEEAERHRLARELHDQVGQLLTAMAINLDMAQGCLASKDLEGVRARLRDSGRLMENTISTVRNLMGSLHPPLLDDFGVLSAMRAYAEEYSQRTGIRVDLKGDDVAPRLAPEQEVVLFRVYQEVLTNVVKHAHAKRVNVALKASSESAMMTIADDGVGFDPAEMKQHMEGTSGWGLLTMKERVQGVGWHFAVATAPGKGTKIVVKGKRSIK